MSENENPDPIAEKHKLEGMAILAAKIRHLVPPQMDYVVLVFRPDRPNFGISAAIAGSDENVTTNAIKAAKAWAAAMENQS